MPCQGTFSGALKMETSTQNVRKHKNCFFENITIVSWGQEPQTQSNPYETFLLLDMKNERIGGTPQMISHQ